MCTFFGLSENCWSKGDGLACFLDFRFYLPKKMIEAKKETALVRGKVLPFQTKLSQAGQMLIEIAEHFSGAPVLAVMDSWFGNVYCLKTGDPNIMLRILAICL